MLISVIIPVYNESATLYETLKQIRQLSLSTQIIVVDDGSTDNSLNTIFGLFVDEIIKHKTNLGKGMAIRNALPFIKGEVVLIQDADLEIPPDNYWPLLEAYIAGNAGMVLGNRLVSENRVPRIILWPNKLFTWLVQLLFRVPLNDAASGCKVISTTLLRSLSLTSKGFEIDAEILAKLLKRAVKVVEVPVRYFPRRKQAGKKINYFSDGFKMLIVVFKQKLSRNQ